MMATKGQVYNLTIPLIYFFRFICFTIISLAKNAPRFHITIIKNTIINLLTSSKMNLFHT